jgi:AraC-like DNA-binding protein
MGRIGNVQYIPFQPGFEERADYQSCIVQPDDALYGIISDFYQFKTEADTAETYTIPDGCGDMIFEIQNNAINGIVCGGKFQRADIGFLERSHVYGIRFYPGAMRHFLMCSAADIVEARIPLNNICKNSDLQEQILSADSFRKRVCITKQFFQNQILTSKYVLPIVDYCIKRIIETGGNISVRSLAQDTGYTERYLQRLFCEHIGFTPKQICIFIRFQRSAVLSAFQRDQMLGDIALECGYYDQSHMNRVYKKLIQILPGHFHRA